MTHTKAYYHGYEAHDSGDPFDSNPYPDFMPEHREWEVGFNAAKADTEHDLSEYEEAESFEPIHNSPKMEDEDES